MFISNFVKILIIFFLCLNSINCFDENEYRIGYIDGFRDARRGLTHGFRHRSRSPQQYTDRLQTFSSYKRPDYEAQDHLNEYEEMKDITKRGRNNQGNTVNYGNLFGIDSNILSKGFIAMTGDCRDQIRPEFSTCIERMANKFDDKIDSTNTLGENNCKALWDLMCCSTDLISKKCSKDDLTVIEGGFFSIQKILEIKGCANSLRSAANCSTNTST